MLFGSTRSMVSARPRGGDERSSFQLCNDTSVRPDFFSISEGLEEGEREGSHDQDDDYRPLRQRLARLKKGDDESSQPQSRLESQSINLDDFLVVGKKYPGSEPISHEASLIPEVPLQPPLASRMQERPRKLTAREYLSKTVKQPSIKTYHQQDLTLTGLESRLDEPAITNVIIHRGDRELVPKPLTRPPKQSESTRGQEREQSKLEEQYVESIQNLTTLLTQNTTLVRTALDTINAVVTKPTTAAVTTEEDSPKVPVERTDQPTKPPSTAAKGATKPLPRTIPTETEIKTRIPSIPSSSISTHSMSVAQPPRAPSPDLIGVPIVAPRTQIPGTLGFLDALLLGEDLPDAEMGSKTTPTPTNPDMIKLASLVTQFEARVDELCGDTPMKSH
ncbi:hypothetical protein GMRT_13423 [Giardia muris]|uniref:Uncharacterized protein n=1 Tax=Giardia muris TaxID=5742 RepID=A0A4Z1T1X1_GIAMU|nr:hypothetical protein GMRT_13423 [Giardia muris]|eukprot:TNJ26391.1 hypothetical protein GMRT_13423 [Giardia muris]